MPASSPQSEKRSTQLTISSTDRPGLDVGPPATTIGASTPVCQQVALERNGLNGSRTVFRNDPLSPTTTMTVSGAVISSWPFFICASPVSSSTRRIWKSMDSMIRLERIRCVSRLSQSIVRPSGQPEPLGRNCDGGICHGSWSPLKESVHIHGTPSARAEAMNSVAKAAC